MQRDQRRRPLLAGPLARRALVTLMVVIGGVAMAESARSSGDALAGSEWRPIAVGGEDVSDQSGLFVRFEGGGKVQGHGGCNRFSGNYRIDAATISFGPLMSTRRGCPGPIMQREAAFLGALEKSRLFLRDRTRLTLKNAQGVTTVRLVQTDWD